MKLVNLTATDVENFAKALPKEKSKAPVFHQEELKVDKLAIALVRRSGSDDAKENTYSIVFHSGDSDYVFIVRPTVHEIPSITLNIIRKATAEAGVDEFASYTVLKDTVTTLKGQVSGMPAGQTPLTALDLESLLKHLKVQ